jgi:adenosylcobinamide-GDP ribazoletransferase
LLAVLLAIVVELLVTGAFHEDAFADFCDAFGGGWSKEDILRILKDSRLGTYGVAGLTIGLGLRCTALSSLDTFLVVIALFASTTIGRWGMLLVMYWLPSLNEHAGLARQAGPVDRRTLLLGAALSIPGCLPMVWTMPSQWFFAILIVIGGAWCFTGYVGKRLGGLTGDCIGAYGFAAQLLVLLAFHVHWRGLSI